MELDPIKATVNIISEACGILSADRATIFKMDETGEQLEIMVAEGASGIRVPVGKGIAGTVAASGELENIKDAYEDARFDSTFDKKSGYRTESVLAAPVRDGQGAIVGVLQVINKLKDPKNKDSRIPFSDMDVEVANILAAQAGIALRNAELYKTSRRSQEKVRALIEVIKSMYSNLGINSLMFTITQRAPALVDAERCTFFLANHKSKELWAMQGDVDIRIPIDKGIAGAVATSGKMITIKDAYEDDRFNQAFDKKSGFRTRQILCMPLLGSARGASAAAGAAAAGAASGPQVVGVIQLINKSGTLAAFSDEDIEIVNTFLTLAAPILEASDLFQSKQSKTKAEESGEEFSGGSVTRAKPSRDAAPAAPIIEEGDEEEEED
ncbi:Pde11 [Symbiodinium sp. KB8]|nr:Pde11 [Symbiodinium sp. KB8]